MIASCRTLVLTPKGCLATSVVGARDTFLAADALRDGGGVDRPFFAPRVVTPDGARCRTCSGASIAADVSFDDVPAADLIVVPAVVGGVTETLRANERSVSWLHAQFYAGVPLACSAAGLVLLAEAGLLDDRTVASSQATRDLLRARYPRVDFQTERPLSDGDNVICSSASVSLYQLTLYLIGKYAGVETVNRVHEAFSLADVRGGPLTFLKSSREHTDLAIRDAQRWMASHLREIDGVVSIARRFAMSPRSFRRRFVDATGRTPSHFLRDCRTARCLELLEQTDDSFTEIASCVGRDDAAPHDGRIVVLEKDVVQRPASGQIRNLKTHIPIRPRCYGKLSVQRCSAGLSGGLKYR